MTPKALLALAILGCEHGRVLEELDELMERLVLHDHGAPVESVTLSDIVAAVVRGGGWTVEAARAWLFLAIMGADDAPEL